MGEQHFVYERKMVNYHGFELVLVWFSPFCFPFCGSAQFQWNADKESWIVTNLRFQGFDF